MSPLKYSDYCDFYAQKCKICKGAKRILTDTVWTCCVCQHTASMKWRLEQFDVFPPDLKYKTWDDFTGIDPNGTHKLTDASWIAAKSKALEYCFGGSDPSLSSNRQKNLIIHQRKNSGQNIIIAGGKGSGKTLIAVLIIKEVAHACRIFNLNMDFKCVNVSVLRQAAMWDNNRTVDYAFLDEMAEVDYLVIDGVDLPEGGHNRSPDMVSMNILFHHRLSNRLPTVIICSNKFWAASRDRRYAETLQQHWGEAFMLLLGKSDNVVIELKKE